MSPPPPSESLEHSGLPECIGPYRVEGELARGGMGVLYVAEDTRLERRVAIKLLPESVAGDPKSLARFEREAKLLASLNHANVSTIHSFENIDGVRFITLELIPGDTLSERLEGGRLSPEESYSICRQVAGGLGAAHMNAIIHCDLKPGNIKVTPDGQVKVLDFGIARALGADLDPHEPTEVLGTPGYISPEMLREGLVDARSDMWSFGCLLYECLTGRRAFPGRTLDAIIHTTLEKEPDWEALPSGTSTAVREILARCLEKDRESRLANIGDAYEVLEKELSSDSGERQYHDIEESLTDILERTLKVGDRAPEFTLVGVRGKTVSSTQLLSRGPLILSFYRGKW